VGRHRRQADAGFADIVELREELFRLFIAPAEGRKAPAAPLATLDNALNGAARRAGVAAGADGFVWRVSFWRPDLSGLVTPVIWSAADLLLGGRIGRVRRCANDQCLFLFLDDSKGGTRRWCSMSACGNRAKAHRHYHKQKGG
jgi:predicted RNA-binding Zn ribbon-like protein